MNHTERLLLIVVTLAVGVFAVAIAYDRGRDAGHEVMRKACADSQGSGPLHD